MTPRPFATLPASVRSARSRRRRSSGGFTLIELVVSLVAGLIVAMAVVGLSREATNSFHEEMRSAQAQMSVRTAIDRLRTDVSRASFMSTPNLWGDPTVVSDYIANLGGAAPLNIKRLAGIRIHPGGSLKTANVNSPSGFPLGIPGTDEGAIPYSANNKLNPDALDITGNINSVDSFSVQTTEATGCGSLRLWLATMNPPAYRLLATLPTTNGPIDAIARAFIPVATKTFIVRLQDSQGRVQYLESCGAGISGGTRPYVDLTAAVALIQSTGKGNVGGEAGFFSGSTVNPVLTVRYKLAPTQPPYKQDLDVAADTSRFDLYRYYLDSSGTEVGAPDLVAEYAVDLKFAFTVDNTPAATVLRTHTALAFDDALNGTYGGSTGAVTATGPQRIRSVRIRLGTRTALADRLSLVSPNMAVTPLEYTNMYRYCSSALPCTKYARVRTSITEVALNNQARANYP